MTESEEALKERSRCIEILVLALGLEAAPLAELLGRDIKELRAEADAALEAADVAQTPEEIEAVVENERVLADREKAHAARVAAGEHV